MNILILLIAASLGIALLFLWGFVWAVKSGQFEDTCTPSMRILAEEAGRKEHSPDSTPTTKPS